MSWYLWVYLKGILLEVKLPGPMFVHLHLVDSATLNKPNSLLPSAIRRELPFPHSFTFGVY